MYYESDVQDATLKDGDSPITWGEMYKLKPLIFVAEFLSYSFVGAMLAALTVGLR